MSEKRHYKFKCPEFEQTCQYKPTSFYQVCCFSNPDTGKHEVKKYKIDCNNEFESIQIMRLSKRKYDKFIHDMPRNKYRVFNTYTLDTIASPNLNDIDMARSELMG